MLVSNRTRAPLYNIVHLLLLFFFLIHFLHLETVSAIQSKIIWVVPLFISYSQSSIECKGCKLEQGEDNEQ